MINTHSFRKFFEVSNKFRGPVSSHVKVELCFVSEVLFASVTAMNIDLDTKMTCQVNLEVRIVLECPSTQSASK